MSTENNTLKAGALAYYDTVYSGLVPCKVRRVSLDTSGSHRAEFEVTADHGAYKRGEVLEAFARWVAPRGAIYRRSYMYRIRPYNIEVT